MNVRAFRRVLLEALIIPVLLLLIVAAVLTWQIQDMVRAQHRLEHGDQVTAQLQELQRLIIDQETGLRGYQLAGDRVMLAPYEAAAPKIDKLLEELRRSVSDDPSQVNRLAEVSDRYQIWLSFSQSILGMNSDYTRGPALNLLGKQLMDNVRSRVAAMLDAEDRLRQTEVADVRQQVQLVLKAVSLTALAVGILIAIFVFSRFRSVSRAYQAALDESRRHTEEVYDSKQWLQTTLESIGDGVIACDAEGRIELMNRVAREMTGWRLADVKGRPLQEVLHIIDEETREAAESPVARVLREDSVVGLANPTLLVRKDGVELVVDDSAAPVRDADGKITGVVLVFRDVTERRRSEKAVAAHERLVAAARLAASIAHEIHNPLDAVANLHYLLWSETDPARRDEYLKLAQHELGRALQISRAMLGLYVEPKAAVPGELKDQLGGVLLLPERKPTDRLVELPPP